MLFSTSTFLFLFLPLVIFIYFVLMRTRRMKNMFLLLASLIFYAYGEPKFVLIMMLSIIVNYIFGLIINHFNIKKNKRISKLYLTLDVIFNIVIIFMYKYLIFVLENINIIFSSNIKIPNILLPIGISFFTFQILSYVIDVYREKVEVQKNIFNLGLYIALFPQLIAGPIVRYETVKEQIKERNENIDGFAYGIKRFIYGLGKKVIISNTMAVIADYTFSQTINIDNVSTALVWLSAIAYALQIYYDFSGYSDMAIGLGRMFGFTFEENFNYPYVSKSISEFWRRWHISLGTWFKDYVYIPLGGSRCSKKRVLLNLAIVWILTGFWHGANWTFILWGILYLILISTEKTFNFEKKTANKYNFLKHIYALFFVLIGWVIFRADNINYALQYIFRMFTPSNLIDYKFVELLIENVVIFLAGIIFATPILKNAKVKIKNSIVENVILALILILSVSYIVKGVYNPFIYFNF